MDEDNQIMNLVKQGDKNAYETLVCKYRKAGIAFAYQMVRDEYLAEDIVQDCFARIYILRDRYKHTASFKTYLFTLIRNKAIDYIRKSRRNQLLEDVELDGLTGISDMEDRIIEREHLKEIIRELDSMQGEYKQMLYLYAVEELSYEQIAKIMGQTKAQVKIKLYRARQKLKMIRKEGDECLEK